MRLEVIQLFLNSAMLAWTIFFVYDMNKMRKEVKAAADKAEAEALEAKRQLEEKQAELREKIKKWYPNGGRVDLSDGGYVDLNSWINESPQCGE